jgi:hypothetical protein
MYIFYKCVKKNLYNIYNFQFLYVDNVFNVNKKNMKFFKIK